LVLIERQRDAITPAHVRNLMDAYGWIPQYQTYSLHSGRSRRASTSVDDTMKRASTDDLTDEVERFHADVRRLAFENSIVEGSSPSQRSSVVGGRNRPNPGPSGPPSPRPRASSPLR
jgi:hypothetical protein